MSRSIDTENFKILSELISRPENSLCVECGAAGPLSFASMHNGAFVCDRCRGLLDMLGFRCKSVNAGVFSTREMKVILNGGNQRAFATWLALWDASAYPAPDPQDDEELLEFMRMKYVERKFSLHDTTEGKAEWTAAGGVSTNADEEHGKSGKRGTRPHSFAYFPEEEDSGRLSPIESRRSWSRKGDSMLDEHLELENTGEQIALDYAPGGTPVREEEEEEAISMMDDSGDGVGHETQRGSGRFSFGKGILEVAPEYLELRHSQESLDMTSSRASTAPTTTTGLRVADPMRGYGFSVTSVQRRSGVWVYRLTVRCADGSEHRLLRSYNEFFDFQCGLLDQFPKEAGTLSARRRRIIPYLPGKKFYVTSKTAEERVGQLDQYVHELMYMPRNIVTSAHFKTFFNL